MNERLEIEQTYLFGPPDIQEYLTLQKGGLKGVFSLAYTFCLNNLTLAELKAPNLIQATLVLGSSSPKGGEDAS